MENKIEELGQSFGNGIVKFIVYVGMLFYSTFLLYIAWNYVYITPWLFPEINISYVQACAINFVIVYALSGVSSELHFLTKTDDENTERLVRKIHLRIAVTAVVFLHYIILQFVG
jgi:hypothetical protein